MQRDYPAKVKFCPLCGAAMALALLMPENAERKVCTRCGFVLFPGPKLVAGCFVVDAGRVLLIRRGIEPAVGKWTFPGGYVDFGENAADAAVRETREEVGMRVTLGPLLGVFTDRRNHSRRLSRHTRHGSSGADRRGDRGTDTSRPTTFRGTTSPSRRPPTL